MSSAAPVQPAPAPPVSAEQFRRVCARFATGVAVLTAANHDGRPLGVTVNSLASVSADPPIVMVCLDSRSNFLKSLEKGREIVFNILGEHQQAISNRFARPDRTFDGLHWHIAPGGSPVLDGVVAEIHCSIREIVGMGDHAVVFADVMEAHSRQGRPLVFADSRYARLAD